MFRYRIRLEEVGTDEPPADLHYALVLTFEDETGEDCLRFGLSEAGVAEMLQEIEGLEVL